MFGSEILEVAIGLAFVYLLLSLICSALNEWLANLFSMRARKLEEGIRNLLKDESKLKNLYEHPLIKGLAREKGKPSYIPSRTFALALLDVVAPTDPASGGQTFQNVRNNVMQLPEVPMKKALLSFIDSAQSDLEKARKNIEQWFDDAMDRVSGWYKRQTQWIILGLALAVSIVLNADTFMIANTLWQDEAVRASVIAVAQETAKKPLERSPNAELNRAKKLQEQLDQLKLPLGWVKADEKYRDSGKVPSDSIGWLYKIVGLLFTAIALSLGAPFWFDTLNRFINLRGSGKRPGEEEPEKK